MVRAFQELEKSENRYEALFSSYPDFIFRMNFEGYFLDIHAPNEKQLYLPIEKILGKKIQDTHPHENVELFNEALEKLKKTGKTQVQHYSLRVQSGEEHFERQIVRSGKNEILLLVRNVTEQLNQKKTTGRTISEKKSAVECQSGPGFPDEI